MLEVTINGTKHACAAGTTILSACRDLGIELPTLCHDDRLQPSGACRLCVVEIQGWDRHATACNTALQSGMQIETDSPAIRQIRRTLLELLAHDYPAEPPARFPAKEFHRCLAQYQVRARGHQPGAEDADALPFQDSTHPYLHADLSQCITCFRCVRICEELQGQRIWRVWNRGDLTQIRPGTSSSLLASDCVSCGACADTCPTGALEDRSVLERGAPERWTRTVCPYCGVGCELMAGTRGQHLVQMKPAPAAPVNRGHLCAKGRYAFDFVHAADRVTEPMIREQGQWQKVSWPKVTEFVAERLRRILQESGPDSIGMLGSARATNEENYLTQKFARVVLGTNNVDCCARVCHAPTAAGMKQMLGAGAATNSFDDIERARTILLCGCNPTENHPVVGARIRQAGWRGATLIIIDPRKIELAGDDALHLQLRPGTNIPLLHAMAHVVVEDNLVDPAALRDRVADFAAFREFIRAWTPERAAALTAVPAELIRQAARLYATHKPSMCFHGLGLTEQVQGTEGVMCLVNLALLTGNFGRPGTGVNPLRGQNNVQGAAHMGCEPDLLTGSAPMEEGRELFESVWQRPVPRARGLNLMQMIDAAAERKLRALWAIGYDVALTNPNAGATQEALARLDLVIVQDLFLNELAREFGHVFLPACSSFEKDGTFMNAERRVQRVRQVIDPVGRSKPDWEILCAMAGAMGFEPQFRFRTAEEIWNEVRSVWRAGAGISYARIEQGGLQWPCPDEEHPGTTILHADRFPHGLQAPLQRVEFVATSERVDESFPFLLNTGRTLYQFNAGTMTARTPNAVLRETDTLDMAPVDAQRLGLYDGDIVRVRSRHGEAVLPLRLDARVQPGQLFATFHSSDVSLNNLTSPLRDRMVMTPEYKVVAATVEAPHSTSVP